MIRNIRQGFTLIETLIAMVMLGVLLTVVVQLFTSQNRVNNSIMGYSDLTADVRMSTVRMNELLSQATYIYPAGQTIDLPASVKVTTGKTAVAFLLASNTPYCPSPPALRKRYCAVLYNIEARSDYTSILGSNATVSPYVLTERVYTSLDWPQSGTGLTPSKNWSALTLMNNTVGLVADAVDNAATDLGSTPVVAARKSNYDSNLAVGVASNTANALIQAVRVKLVLKLLPNRIATREFSVLAQPIPRQGPLDNCPVPPATAPNCP